MSCDDWHFYQVKPRRALVAVPTPGGPPEASLPGSATV